MTTIASLSGGQMGGRNMAKLTAKTGWPISQSGEGTETVVVFTWL